MSERKLKTAVELIVGGTQARLGKRHVYKKDKRLQKEAAKIQRRHEKWLFSDGVCGIGISHGVSAGTKRKSLCLKVYVEEKKPKSKVSVKIPKKFELAELGEIETDIDAIGRVELHDRNFYRYRPAQPGCGLSRADAPNDGGTFGCLVRKIGDPNSLYILSNSHVLAKSGLGKAGDVILQPTITDGGGEPQDIVARLSEWVPFQFTNGFPNLVDAAIAKVDLNDAVTDKVLLLNFAPKAVSSTITRGMWIHKIGLRSMITFGVVQDTHHFIRMNYQSANGVQSAGLREQVLCSHYALPGDSGSAVFDLERNLIGLHFAGNQKVSIFNRIDNVMTLLDIRPA